MVTKKPDFNTLSIQLCFFRFINAHFHFYFVQFVFSLGYFLKLDFVPYFHKTGFFGAGVEQWDGTISDNVPSARGILWIYPRLFCRQSNGAFGNLKSGFCPSWDFQRLGKATQIHEPGQKSNTVHHILMGSMLTDQFVHGQSQGFGHFLNVNPELWVVAYRYLPQMPYSFALCALLI